MDASRLERAARALLAHMDDWGPTALGEFRALKEELRAALAAQPAQAGGGDACCLFCCTELDPDEMDDGSDLPPLAPGVCSECFQRWHDEPVWRKRLKEATDKPAQAGEAVAWGYRGRDGKIHPAVDRLFAESIARALSGPHGRPDNGPWEAVPLYTHPTPRAQPAPEWAGEKCPRCACERNTRGAVSGANGRFAGACSDEFHGEAPDPDATPRAEAATDEARALLDSRTAPEHAQAGGAVYPCRRCGTLRTKAEGGTTFTVCDECWDATHPARPADAPAPASAEAVAREALQHFVSPHLLTDAARAVAHALRAQRPGGAA